MRYPRRFPSRRLLLAAALVTTLSLRAAEPAGTLTGNVSNAATGNLLEGARVEIPAAGLATLTDLSGRYVLAPIPAGAHEVVVTYTGLDVARTPVTIGAGQRAVRNFDLTSAIYKLDAFKVTGEREGGAAAITAQRVADNVKNVVAMDQFGTLPNMSASEVALNLPGVGGVLNEAGLVAGFTIRGIQPGLNTVTMDGVLLTSRDDGLSRATQLHVYNSAMFDQMELTKGHTPDKGADSLGGTLNLKSRSPLAMKEKRRITYNASTRFAPSFTTQVPLREAHRFHPLINVGYQEVFSVLGGDRNLGIFANVFYSEHATGWFITVRDHQNTPTAPAFVFDYRTTDTYNPHTQASVNLKADYRLTPATKLTLSLLANDNDEKFRRRYETRAFTNQNVGTAANSGIAPGFTDRLTQVRGIPASTIQTTMTGPNNVFVRMRNADLSVEHDAGRLQVDARASYNHTHVNRGNGKGGVLINQITGVGWTLDRTANDIHPRFTQTEGPDFTNPANWRPAPANALTNADAQNDREVRELNGNARYQLPLPGTVYLKAGAQLRENFAGDIDRGRRWNYIGTGALPASPGLLMFDQVKTGRRIPQWEASDFISTRQPANPALWREDAYFHEAAKFIGTRAVTETVTAGYVMTQGRISRTGFLAGVRAERTETESRGFVRARVPSPAALQQSDPAGAAARDYAGTRRHLEGRYTKAFPSVHLNHDLTSNLKARLSWSTSFGRPPLSNLLPNETPNEAAQTVTINNPSLLPQTARNWDASLEYYFEPVGAITAGWFHKSIRDYILNNVEGGLVAAGNANGFGGEYAGFRILTRANAGTATVQGWEFTYQQQFTFLPGLLRGLGASANYTVIETAGDFGGSTSRSTNEVPGFIPRTGNFSLAWRHRGFSARVAVNYVGTHITNFSAATPHRNLYRDSRVITTPGVAWHYRPGITLTADVQNLFNEPEAFYRGSRDRIQSYNISGTTVILGVNGRF
ncbi:MAG: TonB-dependent receptor [Opitutaceae bacterium]|nr:TonB-dependent receptor [Opitutaceae bacterium]